MKLPAFQFYPGDWMKDPDLRRCSHAARGVWVDMLCLMFECEQRGVLATGSRPWSREDAAAAVGGNTDVTLRCIDELVSKCVCKVREDGALYSSRMVKDEEKRQGTRDRVSKFREKQDGNVDCNGSVTAPKQPSSSSSSSSFSEKRITAAPPAQLEIGMISGKRVLTDAWCEAYEKFHKTRYVFNGPRDGKAADGLIKTKIPIPDLIALAVAAWGRPNGFNCKQAASLAGFLSRINEIKHELKQSSPVPESRQIQETIQVKSL